jgi:hypothetical protein
MSLKDLVSEGLGSDPEEINPSVRFCLPMVTKIFVLGGLYVLVVSLMLTYSIPAVRIALGNMMFEEDNLTESADDFLILFFLKVLIPGIHIGFGIVMTIAILSGLLRSEMARFS